MGAVNFFNLLVDALHNFLSADSGFFANEGQTIFRLAAIIVLAWFGAEWGIGGWSVQEGLQKFYNLILVIGFGYTMSTYYNTNIPGLGMTFPQIITRECEWLAQQITFNMVETLTNRCTSFYSTLEVPGITDVVGMLCYAIVVGLLLFLAALAFVVIAYGLLAEATMVLVGPIFVPFFIIPRLDFFFWGWLKSLVQFAFFQVIACAMLFVIGNFLVPAFDEFPQYISVEALIAYTPVLLILLLAGIYGMLKVPSLTNQLFSGSAGGGLSNAIVAAASRAI